MLLYQIRRPSACRPEQLSAQRLGAPLRGVLLVSTIVSGSRTSALSILKQQSDSNEQYESGKTRLENVLARVSVAVSKMGSVGKAGTMVNIAK